MNRALNGGRPLMHTHERPLMKNNKYEIDLEFIQ